tara:strand:+ start:6957 stop:7259 length:303 start_codon:yes stop_codon:yes gene_type:complete
MTLNFIKNKKRFRQIANKETLLICVFLFVSLLVLPIVIYIVGESVFGSYAGNSFTDFFIGLIKKFFSGNYVTWLLIMSPYLGWQILRLSIYLWKSLNQNK